MKCKIKAFGVAGEILGGKEVEINISGSTVGDLKTSLFNQHPQFKNLNSLFVAVNQEYATDQSEINELDEVALIPPVAGG